MNSNFTTSHKSKQEGQASSPQRRIGGGTGQDGGDQAEKEKRNKNRFIKLLKEYIDDRKGSLIYDQIYGQL